jgi:hypothetical protein
VKRSIPYIIGAIAFVALAVLLISSAQNKPRRLNERITLKQKDKIPYGFYAARNLLPSLFPNAKIYTDKRSPGYWDSLSITGKNQAVFLVGYLNADEEELDDMLEFTREGNHIFIICKSMSYDAANFFGFSHDAIIQDGQSLFAKDSLRLRLNLPRFTDTSLYIYPGKRFSNSFHYVDSEKAIVLGRNGSGHANFLQYKTGNGSIYIHTAPLAFSNYFLLHKNNSAYFQQAISVIPATVNKVLWNEYYLYKKPDQPEKEPNWLGVLFKYDAFKWAFITAIATLLLYVLLEMRRKQRIIPEMVKPKNASLDFVETIGRLYYDQKNHKNLSQKMGLYFLDHVRSRYKLSTNELNETFINALHAKSGYPVKEIQKIVDFISLANEDAAISEGQLARFHKELENFYQNT